jgi:intracellular septation protein A
MLHTINIFTHVFFGTVGLVLGLIALFYQNNARQHIRFGRYFLYSLTIVVITAFIGILFFRSNPFLLILTLLGGYVGYSGYRVIWLRERPTSTLDMIIAAGVLIMGGLYLRSMQLSGGNWSPAVVYPTLSALVLVAGYDLIKHFWLHQRLKTWWLYEHIYKMLSAFSALFSAFSGTVFSQYKPYSQILPSTLCVSAIVYFIWKRAINCRPARLEKAGR